MDRATVHELLAPRHPTPSGFLEDDVEVPGVGTVRVRGLSRFEVLLIDNDQGTDHVERQVLRFGLIDPVLTDAQIATWQKTADSEEITPVMRRINELSGLSRGADKDAYKSLPGEPDAGVRVFPGPEIVDDGGSAADGDVG